MRAVRLCLSRHHSLLEVTPKVLAHPTLDASIHLTDLDLDSVAPCFVADDCTTPHRQHRGNARRTASKMIARPCPVRHNLTRPARSIALSLVRKIALSVRDEAPNLDLP